MEPRRIRRIPSLGPSLPRLTGAAHQSPLQAKCNLIRGKLRIVPYCSLSTLFFSPFDLHRPFYTQRPFAPLLRDSPSARGIPTGIAPLRRYYGLVQLLRSLSRRRSPKFPMQLSRRARPRFRFGLARSTREPRLRGGYAPLCPAMLSAPQIDSDASFRLHAK